MDTGSKREYEVEPVKCCVCNKPLGAPMIHCRNGHFACAACSRQWTYKSCPLCRSFLFKHSRCVAMERLMESPTTIRTPTDRKEHEEDLSGYRLMKCPVPQCRRECARMSIPGHFSIHNATEEDKLERRKSAISFRMGDSMNPFQLVSTSAGMVLVHLLKSIREPGDQFFCTSFGRISKRFRLQVKVDGSSVIFTLHAHAMDNQQPEEIWLKSLFLLVPNLTGENVRHFDVVLRLL